MIPSFNKRKVTGIDISNSKASFCNAAICSRNLSASNFCFQPNYYEG